MDVVIGKHSFRVHILRSISKDKALKSFKSIDKKIVERAWIMANPQKVKRKPPKKTKE
jgi:hypothetical protein